MKLARLAVVVLSISALSVQTAQAGGIPHVGTITPSHTTEVSLFVLPDGTGSALEAAQEFGGGSSEGPLWFYLYGQRANYTEAGQVPPVAIRFNSADLNADGVVDLADMPLFAGDFLWDGVLNLSDVPTLATGLGSSCP